LKNVLLIVVDTLRPDHLGCYGYERPLSPRLDGLAAAGLTMDAMWSASNFTAPAFTSLFTGRYPHEHGVFEFTRKATASVIHAALDQAGVRTGGVVAFRFFENLLADIWGDIEAVTDTRSFDYAKDLPRAVTDGAVDWLRTHGSGGPFCLFVHYDGPHMPYRLPDEYAGLYDTVPMAEADPELVAALFPQDQERLPPGTWGRTSSLFKLLDDIDWGRRRLSPATLAWIVDKYDASIRYNDEAIGGLLDGLADLGLADDTVVCVLSDHGEAFLEHGSIAHGGVHLYEEVIRTVGMVRDPGRPEETGKRLARPTSHVDVLPALLLRAGVLPEDGSTDPWSVRAPERPVYCEGKAKTAVRLGDLKYVRALPNPALPGGQRLRARLKMLLRREPGHELYDLARDPGEGVNLAGDRERRRPLARLLTEHMKRVEALPAGLVDADERKRIEEEMKRLGYM
jgi:arylsulfatase A-like enzyme